MPCGRRLADDQWWTFCGETDMGQTLPALCVECGGEYRLREDPKCSLCERPLGTRWDNHHLIPKTFKGKETVPVHNICHRKIHSVFTERELNKYYHTIERLLENEDIVKFIKWVSKKDPDFYQKTKDTNRRKNKRGR